MNIIFNLRKYIIPVCCMFCFSFMVKAEDMLKTKDAQQAVPAAELTEYEKQQKILERYKPLIQPRTYAELIRVKSVEANLKLNRLPELGEAIIPERAPNLSIIPYLLKSFAHPGYVSEFQGLEYVLAVTCEEPLGFDDCSTTPHNQFSGKKVYVRFIQSHDKKFNKVPGMTIGSSFETVRHLFDDNAKIFGDGECLQTRSEWIACFDAMQLSVDKKRLQMMPAKQSQLKRFIKISGRGY